MPPGELPRRRPDRLVAIHPVPEYLADADLAARYEEMKAAFGVPWMGVVAMAFAHYRSFYDCLWDGLQEIAASSLFILACADLRAETEAAAATVVQPDLAPHLRAKGYAPREIQEIREVLEVFSAGNYPYLLLASTARLLLAGGALTGNASLDPAHSGAADRDDTRRLVLMEAHHAGPETQALYRRIKSRLGLPFVNTDYRALARWPSYAAAAWEALDPLIRSPAHDAMTARLHSHAMTVVTAFPNPRGLDSDRLLAAASADADPAEVADMVDLFQWLLPELCVNIAILRVQLTRHPS